MFDSIRSAERRVDRAVMSVRLRRVPTGRIEINAAPEHMVCLHVGKPVRAFCGMGGISKRRLQIAGDADIVPAGIAGFWEDESPCSILVLSLPDTVLRENAARMGLDPLKASVLPALQARDSQLEHLAWALKAESDEGDAVEPFFLDSLASAVTARLLHRESSIPDPRGPRQRLSKRQMRIVSEYVESHFGEGVSVEQLARIASMSVSNFKVLFKQSTGIAVHQYVIRRRVEHARGLIARGGMAMSQIALDSGFSHQSHMARCMRKVLGMAPSALLRNAR